MKRRLTVSFAVLATVLSLACGPPATAADDTADLRGWYVGLQGVRSDRQRFDVFGRLDLPPAAVSTPASGGGFQFGHRFGGRFLLGCQLVVSDHDLADIDQSLLDVEVLITGTVLFRPTSFFEPFLRGGIGGGGLLVQHETDDGQTFAFGPAGIAGGGVQLRLGAGVSLELEAVATFVNYLEVDDQPEGGMSTDTQVRTSNQGWRVGAGISLWF